MKKISYLFLGIFFCAISLHVLSATNSPDGGQLLKEIEQEKNQIKPLSKPPVIPKQEENSTKNQGPKFIVKHFDFEGNHIIKSEDIELYLKDYLDHEITIEIGRAHV